VGYVETRDGMEFHVLGRGGAGLLEAAQRFSQKRMNVFVEQANDPFNEPLNLMVARVLERNGLTLAVEDEVCV
jgi:Fe-S oxidoreductase